MQSPARLVEEACIAGNLGNYYVLRRWRDPLCQKLQEGFEFRLGYDPTKSHYYSWLKNQLTKRGGWEAYKTHMQGSENEELYADKVEAALGALIVAERVLELAALLSELLPEGVTSDMIFHSLGNSIRSFKGGERGGRKRRRRSTFPNKEELRAEVKFNFRYNTPFWETPPTNLPKKLKQQANEPARAVEVTPVLTGEEHSSVHQFSRSKPY